VKEFGLLRTPGELLQGSQVKRDGMLFEDLGMEVEEVADDSSSSVVERLKARLKALGEVEFSS